MTHTAHLDLLDYNYLSPFKILASHYAIRCCLLCPAAGSE